MVSNVHFCFVVVDTLLSVRDLHVKPFFGPGSTFSGHFRRVSSFILVFIVATPLSFASRCSIGFVIADVLILSLIGSFSGLGYIDLESVVSSMFVDHRLVEVVDFLLL